MNRLTLNKPVSEMTMTELAHNSCFSKGGYAFYRDFDREINARQFARELANTFYYELPYDDEEFDYEIMDDLPVTENVSKRELIALFYRNLWAQAELYEHLKSYEDTGLTPEQIIEIDKLYAEKCRELAEEKKKHRWIPVKNPPEENGGYICTLAGDLVGSEESFVGMSWYENGEWDDAEDVIAWMPLPEPYKENKNE